MSRSVQKSMQLCTRGFATTSIKYNTPDYRLWGEELVSARTIPPSRRSLTGLFPSRKNDGLIPFESALERDFIAILEFSPSVASYVAQPVKIDYEAAGGRGVTGYPDFLVQHHAKPPMLCDVKYRQELREKWSGLHPRLRAAARYARDRGWTYGIRTEVEIRTPYLGNARFLLPYANRAPDPTHEEILVSTLERLGTTTVQKLLEACCEYEWNRAQLIPTLWCLIGRRNIVTNLDAPVGVDSKIWDPAWV